MKSQFAKLGGIAVLVAVAVAVFWDSALFSISIYTSTPLLFWALAGIAIIIGVKISIHRDPHWSGTIVVASSMLAIVGLPLLRGSYMIGKGDPLTHVGWTKDILRSSIVATDLLYPLLHLTAAQLTRVTNLEPNRSLLLIVFVFVVLFVVSSGVAVRQIISIIEAPGQQAATIGVFSGLLFLPINHIGVYLMPHPTSQAVLFYPLLIFVTIQAATTRSRRWKFLVLLTTATLILLHPMHAIIYTAILGAVSIASHFLSWCYEEWSIHFPLSLSVFLGVATAVWTLEHRRFWVAASGYIGDILFIDIGGSSRVDSTAGSLTDLGTSVVELGTRLFTVSAVFVALTISFVFWLFLRKHSRKERGKTNLVLGFAVSLIPISLVSAFFIVIRPNTIPFRFLGVLMVFGTILGGSALAIINKKLPAKISKEALSVFFVIMLLVSVPVVYPSPYILKGSGEIRQPAVQSYESTAEFGAEENKFRSVRTPPERYFQAVFGVSEATRRGLLVNGRVPASRQVPDHFANRSLSSEYSDDFYLAIHIRDKILETDLYDGFRYNEGDFRYVESDPRINRVYDSRFVVLYRVEAKRQ
ncbi:hypothetical protein [Natronomonas gomsonensis]|uniref:hypothetical protein n=1 Tax=Natronomonas gomsonensis TaxID=1046043 RepID=UPI0015BA3D9E|nr:hypothetical protein [Natronomonas gomsonensis]